MSVEADDGGGVAGDELGDIGLEDATAFRIGLEEGGKWPFRGAKLEHDGSRVGRLITEVAVVHHLLLIRFLHRPLLRRHI